ncbi:hypothetical protein IMG5_144350 [Ichthyophthirius multifiliis]|uniref:Furin n=1 Tax=Ichthyophthirius multifiliis TaxID=5932 RepID=G0QXP2_ICHMU|nr:hypothetical protein IMG5_144350 [Ichthyophthirius multifiliis]EGR30014.1 hypothetical protein IMG5_144350 [Ichthyophthirius multifiliis]|eukprot:XP_004031250.1 hypothetical protein IMG5_144350 [Ichthyophthirius multifiliis]
MCPLNCSVCSLTLVCISCILPFKLIHNTTTNISSCSSCDAKQFYNSTLKQCQNCPDFNCQNCEDNTGLCIGPCDNSFTLNVTTGTCTCETPVNLIKLGICIPCALMVPNCLECTQVDVCTKCSEGLRVLSNTNTCGNCVLGNYYDVVKKLCLPCRGCTECADTTGICVKNTCIDGYIAPDCICSISKVVNPLNQRCIDCSDFFQNCQECNMLKCFRWILLYICVQKMQLMFKQLSYLLRGNWIL